MRYMRSRHVAAACQVAATQHHATAAPGDALEPAASMEARRAALALLMRADVALSRLA
jgi:hypothetical protein